MNVLEKILEEIESREFTNTTIRHSTVVKMKDIRSIFRKYMDKATYKRSDDLIDRKTLKEEVESFRITITGMRNGKTMTAQVLEEYKKSILRIIDEQPMIYANDGWIPVEDRLPEETDSIFKKFKDTNKWSNAMWEKKSEEVNITYELEDGTRKSGTSYTIDGKWKCEKENRFVKWKVIAWQPLPESYKPKKHEKEHKNTQQNSSDQNRKGE